MNEQGKELVTINRATALEVFSDAEQEPVKALLTELKELIESEKPTDISTNEGRKAVAAYAYRIAQTKTYLEGIGAELAKDAKELPKKIDANRKLLKDTLDEWRDEVRAPLTAYEAEQEAHKQAILNAIDALNPVDNWQSLTAAEAELLYNALNEVELDANFYEDYYHAAQEQKSLTLIIYLNRKGVAEKAEAEAAELNKLRAEAAERAEADRIENIKKEAAAKAVADEKARQAAEQKAKDDAAQKAQDDANREILRLTVEAENKAKAEADEKAAEAAREANRNHVKRLNNEALADLSITGLTLEQSKAVVTAIAKGLIRNVTIKY